MVICSITHDRADQRLTTGSWMEFGVWEGRTINGVADYRKKNCDADPNSNFVYGFDTFTGLPEAWGEFRPSVSLLLSSEGYPRCLGRKSKAGGVTASIASRLNSLSTVVS